MDAADKLTPRDEAELTRKLEDLQKRTGVQFAVAIVPSLGGEEIEPYANGLFRKWKIGEKGADNGLLLIWAPSERKIRFEVGRGLEGTMTDAQSKLILHNDIAPKLKAGDGIGALTAGVDDAIAVLTRDPADLPPRLKPVGDPGVPLFVYAFIAIFILVFVLGVITSNRRRSWSRSWTWGPGGWVVSDSAPDTSSGSFTDTSSSSSGSSDSFSGGGGGDSGGGGASDSY